MTGIFLPIADYEFLSTFKDKDYYDRKYYFDATDFSNKPKSAEELIELTEHQLRLRCLNVISNYRPLTVSPLPSGAVLIPNILNYTGNAGLLPYTLFGCVFSEASHLPDNYEAILDYWNPPVGKSFDTGAAYYQNQHQSYMVQIDEDNEGNEIIYDSDRLLTEGFVAHLSITPEQITQIKAIHTPFAFIEVKIPVDHEFFLGEETYPVNINNILDLTNECNLSAPTLSIYLSVSDILMSPDPENIFMDMFNYEMIDYGYHY